MVNPYVHIIRDDHMRVCRGGIHSFDKVYIVLANLHLATLIQEEYYNMFYQTSKTKCAVL